MCSLKHAQLLSHYLISNHTHSQTYIHICIYTSTHTHRHAVQTHTRNTRCVVWILECRHGWMEASISLRKPSKWSQYIYIFIISFQPSNSRFPQTCSHIHKYLHTDTHIDTFEFDNNTHPNHQLHSRKMTDLCISLSFRDRIWCKTGENANIKQNVGQILAQFEP